MEQSFSVTHVTLKIESSFDDFTKKFEEAIGRFVEPSIEEIDSEPTLTRDTITSMAGMENMYMFPTGNPGKMLKLQGGHNRIKQYAWGNPLMAGKLININLGVALYAPFRMLVYETDANEVVAEYDLPSSYFHQFGTEVETVGFGLDKKIRLLIDFASDGSAK